MIELILACYLAAGATLTVPDGWRVEKVVASGVPASNGLSLTYCMNVPCGKVERTYAEMRREVREGERIEMPIGCEKAEVSR